MATLLEVVLLALLVSSVQGKPPFWRKTGDSGSSSNEDDEIENVKCYYDREVDFSCDEGHVIEIKDARLGEGWRTCNDQNLVERIKDKCDGETSCALSCNTDDLYNGINCDFALEPRLRVKFMCKPDPCSVFYCANGGSCTTDGLAATCQCLGEWTGDRCDVSPCEGFDGCDPGQSCLVDPENGTKKCCPDEANPCASVTCNNGGQCLIEYDSWTGKCSCTEGFTGDNCEIEIDACTNNPCENSGTCQIGADDQAVCTCATSFVGPTCAVDCTQEVTCPDGTTTVVVEGKNRCYFVSDLTAESWMNAQLICMNKGLTLWEPNTEAEKTAVAAILSNNNYWTGASDMLTEGTTIFAGSTEAFSLPFTGTNTVVKDCVEITVSRDFEYRDCTASRRYVCEQQQPCDTAPKTRR